MHLRVIQLKKPLKASLSLNRPLSSTIEAGKLDIANKGELLRGL